MLYVNMPYGQWKPNKKEYKKLKIYGKLDCPSANRWINKGYYVQNRVFFENEDTAIEAGYRPCAVCMKKEYKKWKKFKRNTKCSCSSRYKLFSRKLFV